MFLNRLPARTARVPSRAMVLAAGRGRRMLPLTERIPKPLLVIAGRTVLDMALARLLDAGVEKAVVNAAHLGHMIEDHVAALSDPRVTVSREEEPLETGGGVVKALDALGRDPFYVVNGDSVWLDGMKSAPLRLAEAWDGARMDILLLLAPLTLATGYDGLGDFTMDPEGRLRRREEGMVAPYAYMGLSIVDPAVFDRAPGGPFSLNLVYDRAIAADRLYGVAHDGPWYHIGTPAGLETARQRAANGHAPAVPFF